MSEGEQGFSRALCRKACLQVIYAQAERRSSSQKAASPSKSNRQQRPPTPASAVYVVDKVTDALADVVSAFIQQIARLSAARARCSGRSKCTFLDVVDTLNTVSSSTQSTVRDIARYSTLQHVDFPMSVPEYPILSSQVLSKRKHEDQLDVPTEDSQARRPRPYIEHWMPSIPNAYTFVSNPGVLAPPDRATTLSGPEQRRRVEMSLARLREVGGSTEAASQALPQSVSANSTRMPNNPFTALPILASSTPPSSQDPPLEGLDTPRDPLEGENNQVDSTSQVDETKYAISDQKRARVDRILADSGTIMLSAGAASTPAPGDAAVVPSTPGGDAATQAGKGAGAVS